MKDLPGNRMNIIEISLISSATVGKLYRRCMLPPD